MNPKVSICISVHNTAEYLPRCLDSLMNQTLPDIEIVLVNNGSTDNSEAIMHEYVSKHTERQFVVISQNDKGLAQGRQSGINNASGEYIAFLDADDYVCSTMYEELYNCAIANDADIVECDTIRNGQTLSSPFNGKWNSSEILKDYFLNNSINSMLWLRLYRRSLFAKPIMPELYTNNEDMFGLPCLLLASKNIVFYHKPLHTYSTDNENAVMRQAKESQNVSDKFFNNRLIALKCIYHIENFAGEKLSAYRKEFSIYKRNCLLGFIVYPFPNKTLSDKLDALCRNNEFKTHKSLIHFIKSNGNGRFRDILINLLGFRLYYYLYKIR